MGFIYSLSGATEAMLTSAWFYFINGGWIIILIASTYMMAKLYMKHMQGQYIEGTKQIFYHIKVEKENLQSMLAVEQIFAQLHAIHTNFSWAERTLEGKVNLWVSAEIVSIGGKISYIVRTPQRYSHLVQSAFYAQFPSAEITEITDYMENLAHWDHHKSSWDMWGSEFILTKDWAYPIRTYKDFEHMAAEEKIIDPLAGILEALSRCEAHELMAIQVVLRPIADGEWQPHVLQKVKELKKEEVHTATIWDYLLAPFKAIGKKTLFEVLQEAAAKHGTEDKGYASEVMRMSEGEKKTLSGIEMKMSKTGWEAKIRAIYIAPKGQFDSPKRTALIGGFRLLSGMTTNNLKPDVKGTWTSYNYKISKALEKPYGEFVTVHKKEEFLKAYVGRSMWRGGKPLILNTEELATIYHFPLARTSTPPVERIDIKRGQPPSDLPIA